MKHDLRSLFATVFFALLLGMPAQAQQAGPDSTEDVMLVLDASGSMWGR